MSYRITQEFSPAVYEFESFLNEHSNDYPVIKTEEISNEARPVPELEKRTFEKILNTKYQPDLCYVDVKSCSPKKNVLPIEERTVFYISSEINNRAKVNYIFFFHGFLIKIPGLGKAGKEKTSPTALEILQDQSAKSIRFFDLRTQINETKSNVVLIMPSLGPRGQEGKLSDAATWRSFKAEAIAYADELLKTQFGFLSVEHGNIVYAGHSRGGSTLVKIAVNDAPDEAWVFDGHYSDWENWKKLISDKSQPTIKYMYHNHACDPNCKKDYSACFKKKMDSKQNIYCFLLKGLAAKKIPLFNLKVVPEGHFEMVVPYFRERLVSLAAKADFKFNFKAPQKGSVIDLTLDPVNKRCVDPKKNKWNPLRDKQFLFSPAGQSNPFMTHEYESLYDELMHDDTPVAAVPDSDADALLKDDFPQQTLYLKIPLQFTGSVKPIARTAVFFPSSFNPGLPVDILLYFHGSLKNHPGLNTNIFDYLNYRPCGFSRFNLREEIEQSKRNIVLIAPTLGNAAEAGMLEKAGMLDVFLDQVKSGITEHFLKKKGATAMKKGRLIIAAHAEGGKRIAAIASHITRAHELQKAASEYRIKAGKTTGSHAEALLKKAQALESKAAIKYRPDEFWNIDALQGISSAWIKLAKAIPSVQQYFYYVPLHSVNSGAYKIIVAAKRKDRTGALASIQLSNMSANENTIENFKIIRPVLRERMSQLQQATGTIDWEDSPVGTETPAGQKLWDTIKLRLGKGPANPAAGESLIPVWYAVKTINGALRDKFMNLVFLASDQMTRMKPDIETLAVTFINALEEEFILNPETSSLDLLDEKKADYFKKFKWEKGDFPSSSHPGKNSGTARTMSTRLKAIRPERRANQGDTALLTKDNFCKYQKAIISITNRNTDTGLLDEPNSTFLQMKEDAGKMGVKLSRGAGLRISECKGGKFVEAKTKDKSKVAEFSSHTFGVTIDFNLADAKTPLECEICTEPFPNTMKMRQTRAHKWLFLKGAAYGWFPFMHEPWHWEYNPEGYKERFIAELEKEKTKLIEATPAAPKRRKKKKQREFEQTLLEELMSEAEYF